MATVRGDPEIRWVKIVQGEKEIEDLSISLSWGGFDDLTCFELAEEIKWEEGRRLFMTGW